VTYPDDWIKTYGDSNFVLADPTVLWGITHTGFIRWSEIPIDDPLKILAKARKHGLRYGVTLAFGPGFARTICSFARKDREFTDAEISQLLAICNEIHHSLAATHPLSVQQIDVLSCLARGLAYDEICHILKISRTTLKYHLKGARLRLNVETNIEAVQLAQARNLLAPHPYTGRMGRDGIPDGIGSDPDLPSACIPASAKPRTASND